MNPIKTFYRVMCAAASGGTGGTYSETYTYNVDTGNLYSKAGVGYSFRTSR